ncbi:hypothetical protein AMELA_G00088850 [Ameiurus melas]|uniref:Uncharacterized protein n=1 Tax=Ameiurus melas TaxID=219545 RepID=A0A7J6AW31_AMEME|nr:hypothetical protein AMELA_G00088850 [Ameiurus melas]
MKGGGVNCLATVVHLTQWALGYLFNSSLIQTTNSHYIRKRILIMGNLSCFTGRKDKYQGDGKDHFICSSFIAIKIHISSIMSTKTRAIKITHSQKLFGRPIYNKVCDPGLKGWSYLENMYIYSFLKQ